VCTSWSLLTRAGSMLELLLTTFDVTQVLHQLTTLAPCGMSRPPRACKQGVFNFQSRAAAAAGYISCSCCRSAVHACSCDRRGC
jgi:hypothetical protein